MVVYTNQSVFVALLVGTVAQWVSFIDAVDVTRCQTVGGGWRESGEVPSKKVYEDDLVYAFRDISPVAPVHVLLIPKHKGNLTRLSKATEMDKDLLGHMMVTVPKVASAAGLDEYRLVINDGASACQSVWHLHMHIIGGRPMKWPPG
ncbi:14 kDa zinc-binding protein, putative [Perkinsus marinus ATCC 50983]|uniref:14 kDa zinc-binding protein, putative n=1 Tax=Perkinsus marinus (strain ATCC 50983 / TXsc) TaxID=423536 RepID=C5KAP8_PERM5|nr:14 kDa zinc-binding protein, putative [Perkinsus marinus ATCC 50983]EER18224.1 14 kDa zinc-binding protein, putative [Perkinsus marinus ATCC 50983]|eukprot:XP_002786428.1 14 kDa zinc-binding protein, putative [Perkinsus marinus ATCC 50983]